MIKYLPLTIMLGLSTLLIGCAKPLPPLEYQKQSPANDFRGFTDRKLSENQYEIQIYGSTDVPLMTSFLKRRAGELCKGQGFSEDIEEKLVGIRYKNEFIDDKKTVFLVGIITCQTDTLPKAE